MLSKGKFLKVSAAVFRKNLLEYIRYPLNAIFGLIMPIVWILPIYLLIRSFSVDGSSAGLSAWTGTNNFFGYFMIGIVVATIIMTIFWNIGFALKRLMDIGMLETIWVCPVSKVGYIVAESLFSVTMLIGELALQIVFFRYVFGISLPPLFIVALPWFIPFAITMYGFGIGFAAVVLALKEAEMLVDTLSFVVQGLTGTQNPPQVFPRFLLVFSLAIPITYFIDLLRVESLGISPIVPFTVEKVIIVAGAVLIPIIGIWIFRRVDKRCRIKGNLHVH